MAKIALAVVVLLFGHARCSSLARPPASEAEAACDAEGGGECPERDHVLLQLVEHDRLHKSVTRHHSCAGAGSGCDPNQQPATTTTTQKGQPGITATTPGSVRQGGARATVSVSGRQILVDGRPLHIKGICWSPTQKGERNRADFAGFLDSDLSLMKEAGINVLRTYGSISDKAVLDAIQRAGMWVVPTVYSNGKEDVYKAVEKVNAIKDHPAVLMWSIANEWNYNGIYVGLSHYDSVARINEVARLVRQADPTRPIASIYGEVPDANTLLAMPNIDVWGINAYRGISFGDLMQKWASRSGKPMFFGEYGADAWNAIEHREDQDSQALATEKLTQEIIAASAANNGVCSGGFIFEFADEWWKDASGSASEHDTGGHAPGGGPYPDKTFNEEWWGIVDIHRVPRMAFHSYAKTTNPSRAPAP
mmetsp:Transcript_29867/g.79172  ORF Transcript_29867/g.79172 Transcript_29867/m.79172 type:complete len:421 (-) Transcript_29867:452-1714(-)